MSGIDRIEGYVKGYGDGRVDALRDVSEVLEREEHTDEDLRRAAVGFGTEIQQQQGDSE